MSLQRRFEKEINEGIGALAEHLPPSERTKFALDRLQRKTHEVVGENIQTLMLMCRQGVFIEPPEGIRKRPAFKGNESDIDLHLNELCHHHAQLEAELDSLNRRHRILNRFVENMRRDLSRLGELEKQPNLEKVPELSRNAKRLRFLVQCTQELRKQLPVAKTRDVEDDIARQRQGMSSIRGLRTLEAALGQTNEIIEEKNNSA